MTVRARSVRRCGNLALSLVALSLAAAAADTRPRALADLSLEELMGLEVSLATRRPQKISESAAAVAVVTGEELLRAGVRDLPEALRLVPGFQVGQVDANKWVVSARGFAGLFANKLLVLVDGRSVYSPLFGGVFWESQGVALEDVERIEVIRGPGGTLWGANAVNGIVNVVTRDAADTPGLNLAAGGGPERRFAEVRRGTRLGGRGHLRAFVAGFQRGRSHKAGGQPVRDDWQFIGSGLRADLDLSALDHLTVQGSARAGVVGQSLAIATGLSPPVTAYFDAEVFGADLLARWRHHLDADHELEVQTYYDLYDRRERTLAGRLHTADVDLQHRLRAGRHRLVWGAGYRQVRDAYGSTFTIALSPERRTAHLSSAFLHDEVDLWRQRLLLCLGAKVEHNSYTRFEWQPDARLWWSPRPGHSLWVAATRAVRTPSRADRDVRAVLQVLPDSALFPGAPPTAVTLFGSRRFAAERLRALDAGWRAALGRGWVADAAVFRYRYGDHLSQEPGLPYPADSAAGSFLVLPVRAANGAGAATAGVELALEWQVRPWWQVRAIGTWLDLDVDLDPGSFDRLTVTYPGESPRRQLGLRSLAQVRDWSVCAAGRWVDAIDNPGIGAYATADGRLARRLSQGLELSLVGRNLLNRHHREAVSNVIGAVHTEVEREVYAALSWRR